MVPLLEDVFFAEVEEEDLDAVGFFTALELVVFVCDDVCGCEGACEGEGVCECDDEGRAAIVVVCTLLTLMFKSNLTGNIMTCSGSRTGQL